MSDSVALRAGSSGVHCQPILCVHSCLPSADLLVPRSGLVSQSAKTRRRAGTHIEPGNDGTTARLPGGVTGSRIMPCAATSIAWTSVAASWALAMNRGVRKSESSAFTCTRRG